VQPIAEHNAVWLDCGSDNFVRGAVQHKQEFFQVLKLPQCKSFPWSVPEKSEPRRHRSLSSANFVGCAVAAWARQSQVEPVSVPEWESELEPVDGQKVDCKNPRSVAHKLSPSADAPLAAHPYA